MGAGDNVSRGFAGSVPDLGPERRFRPAAFRSTIGTGARRPAAAPEGQR